MYARMQEAIGGELDGLTRYSAHICRRFKLPSDGEDVLQDVLKSMCEGGHRNPALAEAVCRMPAEKLLAYVKKAIRNAARRLRAKSDAEARKRRVWAEQRLVRGRTGPVGAGMADPGDKARAVRVVGQVYAELDKEGRFAFTVIMGGKSPERSAKCFGVSERTGRRWFHAGLEMLRKAIDRVLGDEFGDQAATEFARLAAIYQGTAEEVNSDHLGPPRSGTDWCRTQGPPATP